MYCFWTGERELGKLKGVVATEPGFMDRREVVNVYFNPATIDLEEIVAHGAGVKCGDAVYTYDESQRRKARKKLDASRVRESKTFRIDSEPKYYLSKTNYQYLPMSPMQATKANALVGQRQDPSPVFSPRQLEILQHLIHKGTKGASLIHAKDWQEEFYKLWSKVHDD